MPKSRVILPKKLLADPAKLSRAITNTLNATAQGVKTDFGVTQQTWKHKAEFAITSPSQYEREVSTDDDIYRFVNDGTRAHPIAPHGKVLVFNTPFQSKTLPRSIASRAGSVGATTVITRKPVQHPGTAAREFDKVIAQKWDKQMAATFQRAIDSEVS